MTEVVCGYYGKLPVSPEFLRLNASGPELRWLDEWLQQGILYAKAQEGPTWGERIAQASPYGFVYVPSQEGRVVCGVIRASQDKAGRSFPFLRYGLIAREGYAAAPWLIPVAMAPFIYDTTIAVRTLYEGLDWEAFRQTMEAQMVQEPDLVQAMETFNRFTGSTTVGQWCVGEVTCMGEAQRLAAEQLFARVMQARRQGTGGVQFPIALDGTTSHLDLAFWLQLYLQQQRGAGPSHAGLFCCWRREQASGTALLSIGPGSPNVVRFLVHPEAQDDAWWNMTAPIPDLGLAKVDMDMQSRHIDVHDSLAKVAQLMCDQLLIGRVGTGTDGIGHESARGGPSTLAVL